MKIFDKLFRRNNLIPKNPGAYPDIFDSRDYIYENICAGAEPIDWNISFELEPLKVENQNGSGSCVGQAWAKYLEELERKENNTFTDLSARFIYSQIYLPSGGAYIRNGGKLAVEQGCPTESILPSYPATEEAMRISIDITEEIRDNAFFYKSKAYASIEHKDNIDIVAQAIKQNHGVVTGVQGENSGWKVAWVTPPKDGGDWGHAIYLVGYGMINGKKYIKFINSWSDGWGDKGYGYLSEDYFTSGNVFALWTLVDQPNTADETNMLRIIGDRSSKKQYIKGKDNVLRWIFNEALLIELHNAGIVDKSVVEWKDTIEGYEVGNPWAVIKSN